MVSLRAASSLRPVERALIVHEDRLFPAEPTQRAIARRLYSGVRDLPIISPHGHTDPAWFASDAPFASATELLLTPDHYLYRMLYSHGIKLDELGIAAKSPLSAAAAKSVDPRAAWRLFAEHWYLFRGTPSTVWLNQTFVKLFGLDVALDATTADHYYDTITAALATPKFRPRALFDQFNIEVLATTESPLDSLEHHRAIRASGWNGRVISAYRPDPVVDPEHEQFRDALGRFAELSGEDTHDWHGYLAAHQFRRHAFAQIGTTSSDHGHPTARTADLSTAEAQRLFQRIVAGRFDANDAELFRAQMLTEMARMSLDDGFVLQIHPGSWRNHNRFLFDNYGRDKGADIPTATEYVRALKPLLDRYGNEPGLTIIVFTLDETSYSRELAPLAGHYPALKLGPAWWFHDSPEGLMRFREQTTETAGFYNTVGFNDDTRAFLSIPARHDTARRVDCAYLARLVAEHRLDENEATEVAIDLAYRLPKRAYRL
ncbi:glucuronate isomerase [Pseudolysobacter antarcticus]|uniref:Uronate isomerase n=1 Tax=Pseudolysobacter antarcticus TaxID=2511995 RepID=A0A411HFY5_9GAMM|nr:glucuronate isomerase [Pseudolysobacter antarcticus]QBB69405.1 glucuronate isomerase [Pseudolysobacter antarcticus]